MFKANRLERLSARRIADEIKTAQLLNESYRTARQSESVRYVIGSMQPIDPDYTKNTYAQGDRVCNQLQKRLEDDCKYEYQGSVTNDTHIRAHSDIDVLVLTGKYITLERPQEPSSPYAGDPIKDLLSLRAESENALSSAFPEATVDASGAKSISIEGGSLQRKIDVVPANWFDSNKYKETGNKIYRGVQILNKKTRERLKNTPFLHNAWIEHKDKNTNGGLRKAARLLKSLKYDSEEIDLSSYDLVAIAFNIPDEDLDGARGKELEILHSCNSYCKELQNNILKRSAIEVPDGHRKVFTEGHATLAGLNQLTVALGELITDVLNENRRSFAKLADARIEY